MINPPDSTALGSTRNNNCHRRFLGTVQKVRGRISPFRLPYSAMGPKKYSGANVPSFSGKILYSRRIAPSAVVASTPSQGKKDPHGTRSQLRDAVLAWLSPILSI